MSMLASIVIGAVLAPGFRATIGSAVAGMGEMQGAAAKMGQALADVGQAWASLHAIDQVKTIASDFEHRLMQAGITADMTNSQVAELRATLRGLSVPDKTNQDVNQLLDGFTALVSAGMKNETATAMLGAMGRAATATGAAMEDLAKTAFTLNDTLGIAPEDMAKSFDKLAFAGKQGQFELKNMARYFPTLGGSAKALGLQGAEAVATLGAGLQIAMKKAADPSEAANNMKNFLAKATAPETVKRFEEFGVDLQQTLMDAVASGQNPMEVLVAKIQELTGGNQFNVQKLFGDQQALDFIIPMLANLEKYKKLKAEIAGASGAVDTDFARMMETNKELTKGLSNEMLKLGEVVGHSLLPGMNSTIAVLTPVVGWLSNLAETSPKTTSAVVSLGTAVVLLPPVIRLATAAWGAYTGSLVALRPALVMAGTAFRAFSSSILFTPIGAAIAAIGVAAFLIIDNWSTVKSFFTSIWDGVVENWRPILAFMGPIGWAAIKIVDNWGVLREAALSLWSGVAERWQALVDVVAPVGEAIGGIFDAAWSRVTAVWDAGVASIMAIWERVRGPLTELARMMGWVAPEGEAKAAAPGAAMPKVGATLPAPANDNPANDITPPGSGMAKAQARGQAVAAGAGTNAAAGAASGGRVEVVVRFENPPSGMRARAESEGGVTTKLFTGPAMTGIN